MGVGGAPPDGPPALNRPMDLIRRPRPSRSTTPAVLTGRLTELSTGTVHKDISIDSTSLLEACWRCPDQPRRRIEQGGDLLNSYQSRISCIISSYLYTIRGTMAWAYRQTLNNKKETSSPSA